MIRFKKYVCTSPEAKIDNWNPQGCLYEWDKSDIADSSECIYCGINSDDAHTIWYKLKMTLPYWMRRDYLFDIKRNLKFFWQRRTRGFDDSELWSLDYTCAKLMAPRLRAFIDKACIGVPGRMDDSLPFEEREKEWKAILTKIQLSFQRIVDSDGATYMYSETEQKEIEEGLDLFREWFFNLWY